MSPTFYPSGYGSFSSSGRSGGEDETSDPDTVVHDPEVLKVAWQAGRTANLRQRWLGILHSGPVARGISREEMLMDLTGRGLPTDKQVRLAYVDGHFDADAADEE